MNTATPSPEWLEPVLRWLFNNGWLFPAGAFIFAWVAMLLAGPSLIRWLKGLKGTKWAPREDTPDSHLAKAGTPSMGGIGIIGVASLIYLCLIGFGVALALAENDFSITATSTDVLEYSLYLAFFPTVVLLHAVLGLADDWSKATGRGGLRARSKLLGQILLATAFVVLGFTLQSFIGRSLPTWSFTPAIATDSAILLGLTLGFLVILVIGTSNAVNLTDGIDGLAAGLAAQCSLVFGFLLWLNWESSQFHFEASFFWLALGGACLGFLAFNKHPARVFMGDTGSLALGAALGAGAVMTHSVFLLPFIGFIFYIEMFSVIAQVLYFKHTKRRFGEGKRLLRRAPLHHHFELGGWSEWRVVLTFWGVNAFTTILGLILWKVGVLPRFP